MGLVVSPFGRVAAVVVVGVMRVVLRPPTAHLPVDDVSASDMMPGSSSSRKLCNIVAAAPNDRGPRIAVVVVCTTNRKSNVV
jgi:hypothetical protein